MKAPSMNESSPYRYQRLQHTMALWIRKHTPNKTVVRFDTPFYTGNYKLFQKWGYIGFIRASDHVSHDYFVSSGETLDNVDWAALFVSPQLRIYERKSECDVMPLRYGFTKEEKKEMIRIVRATLVMFLQGDVSDEVPVPHSRFSLPATVDVALWVKGVPRGSYVARESSLARALSYGAISAARDYRYKPLTAEDLKDLRIQVSVLSSLDVPLWDGGWLWPEILSSCGYKMHASETGWYLPQVHNQGRFSSLDVLLKELAREKVGLTYSGKLQTYTFVFSVDEWIEDPNAALHLLDGPIMRTSQKNLEQMLEAAAESILRAQEDDGNIIPIQYTITRQRKQVDWPRSAFAAFALVSYGQMVEQKEYTDAAYRAVSFVRQYIFDSRLPHQALTAAYLGQYAVCAGDVELAQKMHAIISESEKMPFDPITYCQVASFLLKNPTASMPDIQRASILIDEVWNDFESKNYANTKIYAASYAELFVVLGLLVQHEKSAKERQQKLGSWLCAQQLPNGSFCGHTGSVYAYTRGTSKIVEALATDPQRYALVLKRAIGWMHLFQYNETNTFFLPEHDQKRVHGGFRHDVFNTDVWCDSAGHFILGGSRLLQASFEY